MGFVIGKILALGVPAKFARPLAIVGLILLIIIALGVGKCTYDRSVIAKHDAKIEAATAKADRKADAAAAVTRRADDARITQEATQLEKVQANAPTDADRRLARHRCLRLQQSARAQGKPSPVC